MTTLFLVQENDPNSLTEEQEEKLIDWCDQNEIEWCIDLGEDENDNTVNFLIVETSVNKLNKICNELGIWKEYIKPTHQFNIGDRVHHLENGEDGVVVKQVLSQDVDEDMEPDELWYEIKWDNGEDGTEHEESLC